FLNSFRLYNGILWNDRYNPDYLDLKTYYSDVRGGRRSIAEDTINIDPLFAAPGHWVDPNDLGVEADPNDPRAVWVEGDYHLKSEAGRWDVVTQSWVLDDVTSPCIDAGDPASLIDNEPAPHGERINMGAYGGTAEASKSIVVGPPPEAGIAGDLDGDGL
ncbi:MAG: hypothetical protein GY842_02660, partial [bacterium]|nr:hypothetical protein [bacterium]